MMLLKMQVETKDITQVGMKLMKFRAKHDIQRVSEQAQLYAEALNAKYAIKEVIWV